MNKQVFTKALGDTNLQHYTLIKHTTDNVCGTGRNGWGIQCKSQSSRRLISDDWMWFESEAERDTKFQSIN
jgi:hypothetical protein